MLKETNRQKSIDKLTKPEDLDQCLHVMPPALWLVLAALVTLLIGVCVWCFFGSIPVEKSCIGCVENGKIYIYLPANTDFHIKPNSECYIYDYIPVTIDETDMLYPIQSVLKIAGTEERETGEILNGILKAVYSPDADYSNLYVSTGHTEVDVPDGYVLIKVVIRSSSMYRMLFH